MPEKSKKQGRPRKEAGENGSRYNCQRCGRIIITPEDEIYTGFYPKSGHRVVCGSCARQAKLRTPYVSYHGLEALRKEQET